MPDMPVSDLSRAMAQEPSREWPVDGMFIVAQWGKKKRVIEITSDQFFGHGVHSAPMSGQWLIGAIDRLRKGRT